MENNTENEILETALKVLDRYGWIQEAYGDFEEGFCIMGAIYQGATQVQGNCGGLAPLLLRINQTLGFTPEPSFPEGYIADWNDEENRTEEDVILLLKQHITT